MQKTKGKNLIVFDFDHTIFDDNSDTVILGLLKGGKDDEILWKKYEEGLWTKFMQTVFDQFAEEGVSIDQVRHSLQKCPLTAGMETLFDFLKENKETYEAIIASDSNNLFIEWILSAKGYDGLFTSVYTNPAQIEGDKIVIKEFHSHSCPTCPRNMCKQEILSQHLKNSNNEYLRILYVGDGGNDYCPSLILKKGDILFPRSGFKLEKHLKKKKEQGVSPSHEVCVWKSAEEILKALKATNDK